MRVFHRSWKCLDQQHIIRHKTCKSLRLFLSCTLLVRYKFPENTKPPLPAQTDNWIQYNTGCWTHQRLVALLGDGVVATWY